MTTRKRFLILTLLFSLLFIALITAGSYLSSIHNKRWAIALFLFAFIAALGQITSLALYVRCIEKSKALLLKRQEHV